MYSTNKFKEEQLKLAEKVVLREDFSKLSLIAGCDQAFIGEDVLSAIVVFDKDMNVLEKKYAVIKAPVPYIPGYLFYREGPSIVEAFNKLEKKPDLLMIDGNGILHPRRMGIASHVGLLIDTPTIGVAKKLMCGKVKEGKVYVDNEIRGVELISREHSNPIYISPGHKISRGRSMEVVKKFMKYPHKLPEPLHEAHKYARRLSKEISVQKI